MANLLLRIVPLAVGLNVILPANAQPEETPATAPAVRHVQVDFSERQPPFLGWGTSLCWWAHGVGCWDDKTVDEAVRLITDPETGLGMNIFRYNIGGGDDPTHRHMRRWADVPGFKPTADAPYDWSADAYQRNVLLKLVKARPDTIVEAFSNSPPFWMTKSGCSSGAIDGGANLEPEREADFVRYLVDVAAHYRDQHGLTFYTLEPFNEPDVNWWKQGKDQEGCFMGREQQKRIVTRLRSELDKADLRSTLVSATDANSIDDVILSIEAFDKPALAALGQINAHSYAGSKRRELREVAAKHAKPLWQSETGPLWVGGTPYEQIMKVAERVALDINEMQPQAWLTWQVVSGGEWGCLHDDPRARTLTVGKKFHVLASFTRHIRPGDRFVKVTGDAPAVAALSARRSEAVIVVVNRDKSATKVQVTLSGLASLPTEARITRTSESENSTDQPPASVRDSKIELQLPAESVIRVLLTGAEG